MAPARNAIETGRARGARAASDQGHQNERRRETLTGREGAADRRAGGDEQPPRRAGASFEAAPGLYHPDHGSNGQGDRDRERHAGGRQEQLQVIGEEQQRERGARHGAGGGQWKISSAVFVPHERGGGQQIADQPDGPRQQARCAGEASVEPHHRTWDRTDVLICDVRHVVAEPNVHEQRHDPVPVVLVEHEETRGRGENDEHAGEEESQRELSVTDDRTRRVGLMLSGDGGIIPRPVFIPRSVRPWLLNLYCFTLDGLDLLRGRRDALTPPRRLLRLRPIRPAIFEKPAGYSWIF